MQRPELRLPMLFAVLLLLPLVSLPAFILRPHSLSATTMRQLDFSDLVDRAGSIALATVLDAEAGEISAAGGHIPVVTYRLDIKETLKGPDSTSSDSERTLEVTMLNPGKRPPTDGGLHPANPLGDLPRLTRGDTYLLFLTSESQIGLSTTVGLRQGLFRIDAQGFALNEFDNTGLGLPVSGKVPYSELAGRIRSMQNN